MNELWTGLLVGLGIIALSIGVLRYFELRRHKAMAAAGTALGLTPLEKGERFNFIPVELMRKKGRGIGVGLRGSRKGQPVLVFDLFHPAGKSVSIQTVLMTQSDDRYFPEFAAVERNANFYLPTVDLPTAEDAPDALKKHWRLYTRTGHWPFNAELNDWMGENRGRNGWFGSGWSFEGSGHALYVYRRGTTAKPAQLAQWLDEALAEAQGFVKRVGAAPDDAAVETVVATAGTGIPGIKMTVRTTTTWTVKRR